MFTRRSTQSTRATGLALVWAALMACLLLTACSDPNPDSKTTNHGPRPVHLLEVAHQYDAQVRRFPAVVEATQTAELAFRVGGELNELPWRPGQSVAQGQLVAALDPTDYELALEQAAAQAELLEAQHQRNQRMFDENLISQAAFDQSRADLRVARANLRGAQTNLDYTQLKAPFDGVIAHLHVENYENVAPQQPVATLQVEGFIDVSIQVPERLFARVRRDLDYQPDVVFDGLPGQLYKGQIREWDRIADAATNTYRVVFTLPAPEHINILPGMTATVLIDATRMTRAQQQVVVVPAAAVFTPEHKAIEQGFAYVWLFEAHPSQPNQGTLALQRVQIGNMTNDGVEIIAGLSATDIIVQAGVHHLEEGETVKPWVRERGL